jgi:hypothetical protein
MALWIHISASLLCGGISKLILVFNSFLAIPPTVIVGIYFITKRIIRECNAAKKRAEGLEEVENFNVLS